MNRDAGAYDVLAPLYDRLTDRDIDYTKWCKQYIDFAQLKRGQSILEAGCGTGKMTAQLLRHGLRVTATDLSPQMLTIAGETCRKLGTVPKLAVCDMRKLQIHKPVDAVLCSCDGVNYLTRDSDVLAFFQSAYRVLKPGGVICFDISTQEKLSQMAQQVYYDDRQDLTCLWTNHLAQSVLTMELVFFIRQANDLYQRVEEVHRQRLYSVSCIAQLLAQAGFIATQTMDSSTEDPWRNGRCHFKAYKPLPE